MAANDKILYTDYNTLRDAVALILGTGSGTSGYGQTVQSSTVSGATGSGPVLGGGAGANTISITDYSKLRYDIINIYRHIYGTDPTPANPAIGQIIRWVTATSAVASEYDVSEYNIAEYNAASIGGSDDPYTQFSVFIADVQANRFTCATSQSVTEGKGSVLRNTSWGAGNASIACRIRCSWTSANAARAFFNSGGEVRITSTRANGAVSSQNTAWTNFLNGIGMRAFSAQLPSASLGLTDGTNWFNLTSTYQTWYTLNDSGPYGVNQYRIQARTLDGLVLNNNSGTSQGVDFLVVFQDAYQDPAPGTLPLPEDVVDGDLQIAVSVKRADGILQPEPTTGNFTIQSPTVTFAGNSSGLADKID